jgi:hypothetical protein
LGKVSAALPMAVTGQAVDVAHPAARHLDGKRV